jgi:hypothetical protein
MNQFYDDLKATIVFHLKRGAVVVSEDDLIAAFGRNYLAEISVTMGQDINYATVAKSRIRLSMQSYISD